MTVVDDRMVLKLESQFTNHAPRKKNYTRMHGHGPWQGLTHQTQVKPRKRASGVDTRARRHAQGLLTKRSRDQGPGDSAGLRPNEPFAFGARELGQFGIRSAFRDSVTLGTFAHHHWIIIPIYIPFIFKDFSVLFPPFQTIIRLNFLIPNLTTYLI